MTFDILLYFVFLYTFIIIFYLYFLTITYSPHTTIIFIFFVVYYCHYSSLFSSFIFYFSIKSLDITRLVPTIRCRSALLSLSNESVLSFGSIGRPVHNGQ